MTKQETFLNSILMNKCLTRQKKKERRRKKERQNWDVLGGAHVEKHPNILSGLLKYKHVLITGIINFYISIYRSHEVKL